VISVNLLISIKPFYIELLRLFVILEFTLQNFEMALPEFYRKIIRVQNFTEKAIPILYLLIPVLYLSVKFFK
jgi:hypothetical protein